MVSPYQLARNDRGNSQKRRPLFEASCQIALGLLSFGFFWSYYKYLNSSFPVNVVAVCLCAYTLLGFGFGMLLRGRIDRNRAVIGFIFLTAVFLFSTVVFRNVTTSYLLGDLYYPFPKPPHAAFHLLLLGLCIFLSPLPMLLGGASFAQYIEKSGRPLQSCALFGIGVLLAFPFSQFAAGLAGGFFPLVLELAGLMLYLKTRLMRLAGILCVLISALPTTWKNELLFAWGVSKYNLHRTEWSIYYRLDYITFDDDKCLGIATNKILQQIICPEKMDDWMLFWPRSISSKLKLDRVLILGRADGNIARWIKLLNPEFKSITVVDYDPSIVANVTGRFSRYTEDIFDDTRLRVLSSDLATFLKNDRGRYDLIWLNGIGIRQYLLPKTIIPQENYLLTREIFNTIFFERLSEQGLLFIDWGSSKAGEFYPMIANVPEGVHSRVFWAITFLEPFVGLPLFIAVSSKDPQILDDISRSITRVSAFRETKIDKRVADGLRSSENRPWNVKGYGPMLVLSLPSLFFLVFATSLARKKLFPGSGRPRQIFWLFIGVGVAASLCEGLLIVRNARIVASAIPFGSIEVLSLFNAGSAISLLLLSRWESTRLRSPLFHALVASLSLILSQFTSSAPLLYGFSFLAGAGAGGFFGSALTGLKNPSAIHAIGIQVLGSAIGLLLFQGFFLALGARNLSMAALPFYLICVYNYRKYNFGRAIS